MDYATKSLLADLDGLADIWATFRQRNSDVANDSFTRGLETCSIQLSEALTRFRELADADA